MKTIIFLQFLLFQSIISAQYLQARIDEEGEKQVGPLVAKSTYDPYSVITPLPTKSSNSTISESITTSITTTSSSSTIISTSESTAVSKASSTGIWDYVTVIIMMIFIIVFV